MSSRCASRTLSYGRRSVAGVVRLVICLTIGAGARRVSSRCASRTLSYGRRSVAGVVRLVICLTIGAGARRVSSRCASRTLRRNRRFIVGVNYADVGARCPVWACINSTNFTCTALLRRCAECARWRVDGRILRRRVNRRILRGFSRAGTGFRQIRWTVNIASVVSAIPTRCSGGASVCACFNTGNASPPSPILNRMSSTIHFAKFSWPSFSFTSIRTSQHTAKSRRRTSGIARNAGSVPASKILINITGPSRPISPIAHLTRTAGCSASLGK